MEASILAGSDQIKKKKEGILTAESWISTMKSFEFSWKAEEERGKFCEKPSTQIWKLGGI